MFNSTKSPPIDKTRARAMHEDRASVDRTTKKGTIAGGNTCRPTMRARIDFRDKNMWSKSHRPTG
eukprot:12980611-Alexandrium_andersonii.AAC.1